MEQSQESMPAEEEQEESYSQRLEETQRKFQPLIDALQAALRQAVSGKGKERHNRDDLPFDEQPIMTLTRSVGLGFPLGQACKKAIEAQTLLDTKGWESCRNELLGAIVYLAAAVVYLDECHE